MKYVLFLILLASINCFGQNYKTQIAEHRKKYIADFLEDKRSPLKQEDLQLLRFYDADSTFKVKANVQVISNAPAFVMPVFTGAGKDYVKYALLKMVINGKPVNLTVYRNVALSKLPEYSDYLFLPFTDETNGKETYAGGRYIDLREKDFKDNTVIIDFNKAYNPYCAYGGGYACPKPPDENHLLMAITAGEKQYAGEVKH